MGSSHSSNTRLPKDIKAIYAKGSGGTSTEENTGKLIPMNSVQLDLLTDTFGTKNQGPISLYGELLVTPAHFLDIDLETIEPTVINTIDTEEDIKQYLGDFTYTAPAGVSFPHENIPQYKKINWIKEYSFPSGEYIVIHYKKAIVSQIAYEITQKSISSKVDLNFTIMIPFDITAKSRCVIILPPDLSIKRPFKPYNAITVFNRLYYEHTNQKLEMSQPCKVWNILYEELDPMKKSYYKRYIYSGITTLSALKESYNPFN